LRKRRGDKRGERKRRGGVTRVEVVEEREAATEFFLQTDRGSRCLIF